MPFGNQRTGFNNPLGPLSAFQMRPIPTGWLFYQGTPANGNLVFSISTASSTDKFGNFYNAGIVSYLHSGGHTLTGILNGAALEFFLDIVNTVTVNDIGLQVYDAIGGAGHLQSTVSQSGGLDQYGNATLTGPASYNIPGNLAVALENNELRWFSEPGGSNGAGPWTLLGAITFNAFGATFQTLPITSTAGTAANPSLITTDTWHSLGALTGYTVNIGRYKLGIENEVLIDVNVTGNGAQASSVTFANTLPAAYTPVNSHTVLPMGSTKAVAAGDVWPRISITNAGAVTVVNQGANNNQFACVHHVPLD